MTNGIKNPRTAWKSNSGIIYILLAIEFPHRNYVTTYLLLRPDVTFAASGRSKSLKNTVILLILCQKW